MNTRPLTFTTARLGMLVALLALDPGRALGQAAAAVARRDLVTAQVYQHVSRALGDTLTMMVALPPSYNDSSFGVRAFPVVYVVDESRAGSMFRAVSGIARYLSTWGANWPHVIVIGLSTRDPYRDFTPTRDSLGANGELSAYFARATTGGATRYLDHLEEVFAEIEGRFRVTSNRTLISHGGSGALGMHALATRPHLFRNYLISEPLAFWGGGAASRAVVSSLRQNPSRERAVFVARADVPAGDFRLAQEYQLRAQAIAQLQSAVEALPTSAVRARTRFYPGEEHASVFLPATYDAFRWFFGGQLAPEGMLADVASLQERSRQLGRQLGLDTLPDPIEISLAAESLLEEPRTHQAALALFRANVQHFPRAARSHRDLAQALVVMGDTTAAMRSYEEVVRLTPSDSSAMRRLRELRAGRPR